MSILHLHKRKITTDLARSNFYNVISLAARSRQCFMYITDFYWCVFSVPFFTCSAHHYYISFLLSCSYSKRHSTSSCENSHSQVHVCCAACRSIGSQSEKRFMKKKLRRAGAPKPLCLLCKQREQQLNIILSPFN